MKARSMGAELFLADRRTDMAKLMVEKNEMGWACGAYG